VDDGTCFMGGCTDSRARNYAPAAIIETGECDLVGVGCTFSEALNFMAGASHDSGTCIIAGCLDSLALNFDPLATVLGVVCLEARTGCMITLATNYDISANVAVNDICRVLGCTDSTQLGYSPLATINLDAAVSGACIPPILGCADTAATNFHSAVNVHLALDCTYSSPPSPPPFPEAIVLRLTTSYTLAQLDTLALASTVDGRLGDLCELA